MLLIGKVVVLMRFQGEEENVEKLKMPFEIYCHICQCSCVCILARMRSVLSILALHPEKFGW